MVKITRNIKQFTRLATKTLSVANILERYDLQEYIFNSSEAFCAEIGQQFSIIAKEVPTGVVEDRIDLLAVDGDGQLVIIELKRGSEKLQLLQAIAYAGMAAKWPPTKIQNEASRCGRTEMLTNLREAEVNPVRILLVAEAYDYEVLVAAEWLYERDVELDCVRVALAVDEDSEYLTFTQIFPTPELAEQARKRGRRSGQLSPPGGINVSELLKRAADRKIGPLVDICREMKTVWQEKAEGTFGGSFRYWVQTDVALRMVYGINISGEKKKTPDGELDIWILTKGLAEATGLDEAAMRDALAHNHPQLIADPTECVIRLRTPDQAKTLVAQLQEWATNQVQSAAT